MLWREDLVHITFKLGHYNHMQEDSKLLSPWYLKTKCKMQNVQVRNQKLSEAPEKSGTVSPHLNDGEYALLGI